MNDTDPAPARQEYEPAESTAEGCEPTYEPGYAVDAAGTFTDEEQQ